MATTDKSVTVRKAIVAKIDKVHRIGGDITPTRLDDLEEAIGELLTKY